MSETMPRTLQALIAEAERLFPATFPSSEYPGMSWHETTWDYQRANVLKTRNSSVVFTVHEVNGGGRFHPRFEYALKAYCTHKELGQAVAASTVGGARALWGSLLQTGMDPTKFRWSLVTQPVLDDVERYSLGDLGLGDNSSVVYLSALENFLDWMKVEQVLAEGLELKRSLRLQTPRGMSEEDRRKRQERMAPRDVLDELARFYTTAVEPRDRLLICTVGLMLLCGFRISEVITLSMNSLDRDVVNGREKWFIRYYQRKPGKNKILEENKRWLSPLAAELAQRLWSEILDLTSSARDAARKLEQDTDRVRIWWLADDAEFVTPEQVDRAFGWGGRHARNGALKKAGIEGVSPRSVGLADGSARARIYRRDEVEALLLSRRGPLLTHISGTRRKLHLSDTLLIYFEQFMDGRKRSSEILVRAMDTSSIARFLDGSTDFSPLSADLKTKSHGFRHWLNTVANKAGMSVFLISVWMQRSNIEHNLFYLHDPLDIAELGRGKLRDGKLVGSGAEKIYALDGESRDEQIDSIHMAHAAATVICTLDMTHEECPEKKFCEMCDHGALDPENGGMVKSLRARLAALKSNLERLERLRAKGIEIQERQFDQAREGITEIESRLARVLPVLDVARLNVSTTATAGA